MRNKKKIVAVIVFVIILIVLKKIGAFKYTSLDNIQNLKNWIKSFGMLGPAVYILFYIIACLFFLPALPITVLGGVVFGPVMGTFYTIIGSGIGLSLAFLCARYVFRDLIQEKFGDSVVFKKIDEGLKKQGWRIIVMTRLIPIFPFALQNFVYGLTDIRFLEYSILSIVFIIPGTAAYTFSAGAIASGEGFSGKNLIYLGIGALCFVFVSLIPSVLKKKTFEKETE